MEKEISILNHIHQTADMGRQSLLHLTELVENKELLKALKNQINGYKSTYDLAEEMLKDRGAEDIDCAKTTSVFMANMMLDMKQVLNPTESNIAEMVIQGSTKGITKLTKLLNSYGGEDKTVLTFAQGEIENERSNIEELKRFL
ncbi:MAG: hypothetical protein LUG24_06135 [Clostridiales bacterium]|nr:hypothetical protein [Clostridiales bacterium]